MISSQRRSEESKQSELVKENKPAQAPLSLGWLLAALAASAAILAAVASIDYALPAPLGPGAPPTRFRALAAHQHLVNLTSIGPRVRCTFLTLHAVDTSWSTL